MKFETENKGVTPIDVATAMSEYLKTEERKRAQALLDSYRRSADLTACERIQRADKALDRISD